MSEAQPSAKTPASRDFAARRKAWVKAWQDGAEEPYFVDPRRVPYAFAKRCFDFVGALVLIVILSPLMVLCAILVAATSRGPIIYRSKRCGLGGRTFGFMKFRSMYQDAEARRAQLEALNEKDGPIFKMRHDPRITPVGRFMRRYSLDELPQLFHVLTGEMSLVGPRPPLPREVAEYDERTLERLSVKPGMTCYWQIMGRCELSFEEWIDLDLKYIEEMNFWVDLKILACTPIAAIRGVGAY